MANIGEITQGSSYTGNAALGGGLGVGITIDPSPIARLATFTFYSDRDKWEKKQKDDALAANKIALITAFDVNSPLKPYADDLLKRKDRIRDFLRSRPDALSIDKDKEGYQELYTMIGEFENARKHATSNDVLFNKEKAAAETEPNAANRKAKLELLNIFVDDLFSNGVEDAYNKQLQSSAEIKPDDYKIGKIPTTDIFTITPHPNRIDITGKTYGDMNRLDALIEGEYLNLTKESIADSPEYKQMSDPQKKRALLEEQIRSRAKIGLDNTAATVNALVEQFRNKIGKDLTIDQIPESELSKGGSIGGYIRLAKKFNEQVREINSATGRTFSEIDIVDGASPTELIKLEWFGANGETLSKDLKPTTQQSNDQIEKDRLALGWYNAKTGRIQEDRLAAAAGVTKDMATSAKAYAEALFSKLNSLANKDGIIPKSNLSKLTIDELKYLGSGSTTENKFSLESFDLNGVTSILIDPDGTIKSFTGGTNKSLGTQRGQPINISTIATNKLGDEMTVTAGKEGYNFNNLVPLYQSGSTDVQKQFTDQQTKETKIESGYEIPKGAVIVYSKSTGKALGYTLNGKNYKF